MEMLGCNDHEYDKPGSNVFLRCYTSALVLARAATRGLQFIAVFGEVMTVMVKYSILQALMSMQPFPVLSLRSPVIMRLLQALSLSHGGNYLMANHFHLSPILCFTPSGPFQCTSLPPLNGS
eukprot:scpid64304/ scgid17759/ 